MARQVACEGEVAWSPRAVGDFGYKAVQNKIEIHDIHATMLHLLGVEHTSRTFRFGGRDMRLADVFGHVLHDVLE